MRRRLSPLFLSLALIALPSAALASAESELQKARDSFEYGDYERAAQLTEELLKKNVLSSDEQLIDANRIVALAYFYGKRADRKEKAERYFLQLLSIEPEYRLDPFFTPPAAVEFFDNVRKDHEEQLAPIREQRRVAKEARRAEELARQRFLEEQSRTAPKEVPPQISLVERRHMALVFLPFGVGQFQNGDTASGTFLASVQVIAGATSVASFFALQNLSSSGRIKSEDLQLARTLDAVKWSSAAIFYLAWGYGVIHAWSRFEPEVVLGPASAPEAGPPTGRSSPGDRLRLTPLVSADADGATLGLSLQF